MYGLRSGDENQVPSKTYHPGILVRGGGIQGEGDTLVLVQEYGVCVLPLGVFV